MPIYRTYIENILILTDYKSREINVKGPSLNVSWYEANETCASYNATLLSFSGYKDFLAVQTLVGTYVIDNTRNLLHIGLSNHIKVNRIYIISKSN